LCTENIARFSSTFVILKFLVGVFFCAKRLVQRLHNLLADFTRIRNLIIANSLEFSRRLPEPKASHG